MGTNTGSSARHLPASDFKFGRLAAPCHSVLSQCLQAPNRDRTPLTLTSLPNLLLEHSYGVVKYGLKRRLLCPCWSHGKRFSSVRIPTVFLLHYTDKEMCSDDSPPVDDAHHHWVVSVYAPPSPHHATASSILPIWSGAFGAFTSVVDGNWECMGEHTSAKRPLAQEEWVFLDFTYGRLLRAEEINIGTNWFSKPQCLLYFLPDRNLTLFEFPAAQGHVLQKLELVCKEPLNDCFSSPPTDCPHWKCIYPHQQI